MLLVLFSSVSLSLFWALLLSEFLISCFNLKLLCLSYFILPPFVLFPPFLSGCPTLICFTPVICVTIPSVFIMCFLLSLLVHHVCLCDFILVYFWVYCQVLVIVFLDLFQFLWPLDLPVTFLDLFAWPGLTTWLWPFTAFDLNLLSLHLFLCF